jgi:hypothetical protein
MANLNTEVNKTHICDAIVIGSGISGGMPLNGQNVWSGE